MSLRRQLLRAAVGAFLSSVGIVFETEAALNDRGSRNTPDFRINARESGDVFARKKHASGSVHHHVMSCEHTLTTHLTGALLRCACSVLRLQHQAVLVKGPLAKARQSRAREMRPTPAAFPSEVIRSHSARNSRFSMRSVTGITKKCGDKLHAKRMEMQATAFCSWIRRQVRPRAPSQHRGFQFQTKRGFQSGSTA